VIKNKMIFDMYISLIKIFNKRGPGWDIEAYQKTYKMGGKKLF
jgi:hypothetical protein